MSVRKALLAVTAIGLSISFALPAGAEQGLGFDTQVAGSVVATTEDAVDGGARKAGTPEMWGECYYHGETTTAGGKITWTFGGAAMSYSTVPTSIQPIGTAVQCTLVSPKRFPADADTLTMSTLPIRMSGPAVATPPTTTGLWPIREVYVCVTGDAQFGPIQDDLILNAHCSNDPIPIVP